MTPLFCMASAKAGDAANSFARFRSAALSNTTISFELSAPLNTCSSLNPNSFRTDACASYAAFHVLKSFTLLRNITKLAIRIFLSRVVCVGERRLGRPQTFGATIQALALGCRAEIFRSVWGIAGVD